MEYGKFLPTKFPFCFSSDSFFFVFFFCFDDCFVNSLSPTVFSAVVTEIAKNEETGVTLKMAVGNSYEIIYGQLQDLKV